VVNGKRPTAFGTIRTTDVTWEDKRGNKMLIQNMSKTHVYATVRLLRRHYAQVPDIMLERYEKIIIEHPEYLL